MSQRDDHELKIFAGRAGGALASAMCGHLGLKLGAGHTSHFDDGEIFVKLDEDVRGRDCFVVQSTCDPVNSNLVELLIYMDCLRRASARRITAVIPYFGYARQDRKDEGRVPITAKLVANLITTAGADRVLCMDLHAAQIQGFFDIPVDHMSSAPVFLEYFNENRAALVASGGELVVVSPDVGNVKIAKLYSNALSADLAIIHKRRHSGSTVSSTHLIGDVRGRTVLMIDDMISTAGTVCEAARLVMENGATQVVVAATHGVLVGPAMKRLLDAPIRRILVTDTIPNGDRTRAIADKLDVLSVSRLMGAAVHRIHHDQSISALFQGGGETKR